VRVRLALFGGQAGALCGVADDGACAEVPGAGKWIGLGDA